MYGLWTRHALNHFHLLSVSIVVNLSINECGYGNSSYRKVHVIFFFGKKSSKSITDLFFFFGKPPKTDIPKLKLPKNLLCSFGFDFSIFRHSSQNRNCPKNQKSPNVQA